MSKRRLQWPSRRSEVRALVSELADLASELGHERLPESLREGEGAGVPEEAAAAPVPALAGAGAGGGLDLPQFTEQPPAVEPPPAPWAALVEDPAADVADLIAGADLAIDPELWLATTPAPEAPGRPWTPAAAAEGLGSARPAPVATAVERDHGHSWGMTIAVAVAVLAALTVFLLTHLDLVHTAGPSHAVVQPPFTVDAIRPVQAASEKDVPTSASVSHFPADASVIYLDVRYSGAAAGTNVEIRITHDNGPGVTPSVLSDESYSLAEGSGSAGGERTLLVLPPPGGFPAGAYTVTAQRGSTVLRTVDFTVG